MFIPWSKVLREHPYGDDWNGWQCGCMDVTGKQACTRPNCEGGFAMSPPWEVSPEILAKNVTKNGVGLINIKVPCYRLIKLSQRRGPALSRLISGTTSTGLCIPAVVPKPQPFGLKSIGSFDGAKLNVWEEKSVGRRTLVDVHLCVNSSGNWQSQIIVRSLAPSDYDLTTSDGIVRRCPIIISISSIFLGARSHNRY